MSTEKLRSKVFSWLECWYNKCRRHSALNNLTIDEFWEKYAIENGLKLPKTQLKTIIANFPTFYTDKVRYSSFKHILTTYCNTYYCKQLA